MAPVKNNIFGIASSTSANNGVIEKCYSFSPVVGENYVGGLVGYSRVKVINCYASGPVFGNRWVGGLAGYVSSGPLVYCYSKGFVMGTVDGMVGLASAAVSAIDSYWNVDTGNQAISALGLGLSNMKMTAYENYITWECDGAWTIDVGNDAPRLAIENAPGIPIARSHYYGGGARTAEDPYLIFTPEQMYEIGLYLCDWDKHFLLMADQDMSGFDGRQGRPNYDVIGNWVFPFSGVFDGGGYSISNLHVNDDSDQFVGMFGVVDGWFALVTDLTLIDPNISVEASSREGSIAGHFEDGSITHCIVERGSVRGGSYVGGLVGYNDHGEIDNSSFEGSVTEFSRVGGIEGGFAPVI